MTSEEAKGNLRHAIRWNEMPKKEALDMAIKALEQEPCEDAISRQAVRDTIFAECTGDKLDIDFAKVLLLQRAIKALPSVNPQSKTGHWGKDGECPFCGYLRQWDDDNFCGHCGARIEPQESENKE